MKKLWLILIFVFLAVGNAFSAEVGEDGLHKQDWFAITFRDIAEDIQSAKDEEKRLALIFEQRGCIYCQLIHETVLTDPDVKAFLKKHFTIVQYNLYGDEEVIDLDGETLSEKSAAKKWGVLFTPTIVFLPDEVPEGKSVKQAEVARMPGAFRKGTFLDMFTWVQSKGYATDEGFQQYHARRIKERQAAGQKNTD